MVEGYRHARGYLEVIGSSSTISSVRRGRRRGGAVVKGRVSIGRGFSAEQGSVVFGPAIIGENCTIDAGTYIARTHQSAITRMFREHTSKIRLSSVIASSRARNDRREFDRRTRRRYDRPIRSCRRATASSSGSARRLTCDRPA